jgi:hypothetical protein
MFEIKVTVEATELVNALNNIAAAMRGAAVEGLVSAFENDIAVAVRGAAPTPAAPTFTRDQIMYAGSTLVDAGKSQGLINLLHSFGVQAVTELRQEQLGAFATAMRDLGAKI